MSIHRMILVGTVFLTLAGATENTFGASAALRLSPRDMAIVLANDATAAERTAAKELKHYLDEMTGAVFTETDEAAASTDGSAIYVGPTQAAAKIGINVAKLSPEEWIVRAVNGNLILTGGQPRGTLYAVYHFLEDVIGVHWWNPWEEYVPKRATLEIAGNLNLRGKPVMRYRDIYMLYGYDGGRFAARNRLNRQGDAPIAPNYGGGMDYGPPYHVHTFYMYFPPKQYFESEPDFFSLINGKRDANRKQLCLTNVKLRKQFLAKLRAFIESSRSKAKKEGRPAPLVFDVSQNDWGGACQCDNCQAIARAEGSESGPLLDFVNFLADGIKDDYPDVFLDTLAYSYTQKPPKSIKPRDNVIIRLCDTTSTFTRSITDPENRQFHDCLLSWSKIAKNLRIWDYAVTYAAPRGLPFPSVHTFQRDFQFYAEHNVEGVFTELEFPVIADMRDMKVWMMMKLLENPYSDYDELLTTFTDGFYGAAGPFVRDYLVKLEAASKAHPTYVSMGASPSSFAFCDIDMVLAGQSLFDEAERVVAGDTAAANGVAPDVLLRRIRHARLSLDRLTLVLFRQLTQQWVAKGKAPEDMPLDRDTIANRIKTTWYAEIDRRLPEGRREAARRVADSELLKYTALQPNLAPPAKFRNLPRERIFDFTADMTRNWRNIVKVVKDDEAESGITNRLEFQTEGHPVERYKLPMPWGLYDQINKKGAASASIKPQDVPSPGYHWYKLGVHKLGPSYYLYFFWSWIIQLDLEPAVDTANLDQKFEIWARIKFEGPAFPHGREGMKNAICVERVVLVKVDGN